jgi:hypothetical protein
MNTKNMELVPQEPRSLAPQLNTEDPIGLFKLAIESKAGADTLERVMAVRRELRAEHAASQYHQAMAQFQSRCPIIVKRKAGAKNAYRYAPLDDIVSQVRDLIRECGFSFRITSEVTDKSVKAICTITHEAGHSEESVFAVPVDTKNPMMTEPQRFGGALTFAKRYAVCNGFGILTADEDIDGAGTRPKPAGPAHATDKTREWFLTQIEDLPAAIGFARDIGWLAPDEGLEKWPLEHVPVSRAELAELRHEIEEFAR